MRVGDVTFNMSYFATMLKRLSKETTDTPEQIANSLPDAIINQELVRQEGIRLGLMPSPEEVEAEIRSRVLKLHPEAEGDEEQVKQGYKALLKDSGVSDSQYRTEVAVFLIKPRLMDYLWNQSGLSHVQPHVHLRAIVLDTPEKVAQVEARLGVGEDFVALAQEMSLDEASKGQGGDMGWIPKGGRPLRALAQVHLRLLLLDSEEAAKAAQARLAGGEDFVALVRELSKDETTKAKDGDLGWLLRDYLRPELSATADLEPGQTSQPISTTGGYALFQMVGKAPGGQIFDEIALQMEPGQVSPPLFGVDGHFYFLQVLGQEDREVAPEYVPVLQEQLLAEWLSEQRQPEVNLVQNFLDEKKISWALAQVE